MGDSKGKRNKGRASQRAEDNPEIFFIGVGLQWQGLVLKEEMAVQAMVDQNCVLDFAQSQLSEEHEKIENVKRKVRKLERESTDLKEQLKSTERAIADLKKKVHALGSDKKKLQEEVEKLETKVQELEARIESYEVQIKSYEAKIECLQVQNDEQETQMDKLRRETEGLRRDMNRMGEELDESNRDWATLRKRINQIELQQYTSKPSQELKAQENMAFIIVGEMCHQLQNKMYEKVLPDYFEENYGNYTVEQLKEHIEDESVVETEKERDEAAERWEDLKKDIGWNDKFTRTIACLVKTRNISAHPSSLNEEKLREALDVIKKKGKLLKKGYESAEKAAMLINMWVKLCVH